MPLFRSPTGDIVDVPLAQAEERAAQGYTPMSTEERGAQLSQEALEARGNERGILGTINAGATGLASGLTLGASDVLLGSILSGNERERLLAEREANRGADIAGNVVGSIAPALLTGGGTAAESGASIGARILESTPAGLVSKAGSKVAALGEGAGILGRTAAAAGQGIVEGAAQSGGAYLSQVALEDKPLSAEAFVGAMGKGALFGGALGGGLGLAESALMRAKALFPRREVTREAAEGLEREAQSAIKTSMSDGDAMQQTAAQQLRELKLADQKVRLETSKQIGDIKIAEAQARLDRQQVLTERARAGPARRQRKVFDESEPVPSSAPEGSAPGPTPTPTTAPAEAAAPSVAAKGAGDDLMTQLQATKGALDEGATLGQLSNHGTAPELADEALAASNPQAAKIMDAAKRERMTREDVQAWIKGRKAAGEQNAAERGYSVSYERSATGGRGAAGIPAKMDRVTTYGAETEASKLAAARTTAKVAPEERLAADAEVDRIFGKGKRSIGEEIVEGAKPPASLDDQIEGALRKHNGEHADLSDDLTEAAQKIGAHEEAAADLAEALGEAAPATAKERAQAYRQATASKAESDAAGAARTADDLATKLAPEVARRTGKGVDGGMFSALGDLGAGLEVLRAMGVSTPDLSAIPVIGPVLSLVLKARAAMGVFRRAGGSVPKTAETMIASKAAAVRNRINTAVTGMLDVGAKAARTATAGAGTAGILSQRLFPGPGSGKEKAGDEVAAYRRRLDELSRASQPGAVIAAVREHVQTSDPALQQEIAATLERKLGFLNTKAPREMALPTLLKSDGEYRPSKAKLAQFARYVQAAEDPAGVLEDVAAGRAVSIEAAETLRKVYPALFREAQKTLMERAETMQEKLPYSRRVSLSILFQVPVDGTMSPSHIRFLQQGSAASAPTPAQGSPAGAPPTPSVSGSIGLGDRMMTPFDRRAGA